MKKNEIIYNVISILIIAAVIYFCYIVQWVVDPNNLFFKG